MIILGRTKESQDRPSNVVKGNALNCFADKLAGTLEKARGPGFTISDHSFKTLTEGWSVITHAVVRSEL
jgi:hypothetical protein